MQRLPVIFNMPGLIAHEAMLYEIDKLFYIGLYKGGSLVPLKNLAPDPQFSSLLIDDLDLRLKYENNFEDMLTFDLDGEFTNVSLHLHEAIALAELKQPYRKITSVLVSSLLRFSFYQISSFDILRKDTYKKIWLTYLGNDRYKIELMITHESSIDWYAVTLEDSYLIPGGICNTLLYVLGNIANNLNDKLILTMESNNPDNLEILPILKNSPIEVKTVPKVMVSKQTFEKAFLVKKDTFKQMFYNPVLSDNN